MQHHPSGATQEYGAQPVKGIAMATAASNKHKERSIGSISHNNQNRVWDRGKYPPPTTNNHGGEGIQHHISIYGSGTVYMHTACVAQTGATRDQAIRIETFRHQILYNLAYPTQTVQHIAPPPQADMSGHHQESAPYQVARANHEVPGKVLEYDVVDMHGNGLISYHPEVPCDSDIMEVVTVASSTTFGQSNDSKKWFVVPTVTGHFGILTTYRNCCKTAASMKLCTYRNCHYYHEDPGYVMTNLPRRAPVNIGPVDPETVESTRTLPNLIAWRDEDEAGINQANERHLRELRASVAEHESKKDAKRAMWEEAAELNRALGKTGNELQPALKRARFSRTAPRPEASSMPALMGPEAPSLPPVPDEPMSPCSGLPASPDPLTSPVTPIQVPSPDVSPMEDTPTVPEEDVAYQGCASDMEQAAQAEEDIIEAGQTQAEEGITEADQAEEDTPGAGQAQPITAGKFIEGCTATGEDEEADPML